VLTARADLEAHTTDWRGQKTGHADALLLPRTTEDMVAIVRCAGAQGIALVPQGGNTGLVGGSVPESRSARCTAIVSTRRMNRILAVDPAGLTLVVEAGAILADVHQAAEAVGCCFPLSLGAKGSATVGGLASTNAGGTQVLRHGTMRALILGLEAVLPDGSLLRQLAALRKDNSGYDVKQLLIGAEGTLGIITKVALRLAPLPAERATGWAGVNSPAQALLLLARLRRLAGETVESFELISSAALDLVLETFPNQRPPLEGAHAFHVLIELAGPSDTLATALADAIAAREVEDATVAASLPQAAALWALRETIPDAERREGGALKNDISVAVADLPAFHDAALALFAQHFPGSRPLVFGHLGDGNLHLNLRPPANRDGKAWLAAEGEAARTMLHDLIAQWRGSISAEHGIGTLKAAELERLGDPGKLAAMRAIKQALDPNGIMNPGKLIG
jgi:FAD/FMN-containing dehydrogenase